MACTAAAEPTAAQQAQRSDLQGGGQQRRGVHGHKRSQQQLREHGRGRHRAQLRGQGGGESRGQRMQSGSKSHALAVPPVLIQCRRVTSCNPAGAPVRPLSSATGPPMPPLTVLAAVIATLSGTSALARYATTLLAVPPGQLPTMHSLRGGWGERATHAAREAQQCSGQRLAGMRTRPSHAYARLGCQVSSPDGVGQGQAHQAADGKRHQRHDSVLQRKASQDAAGGGQHPLEVLRRQMGWAGSKWRVLRVGGRQGRGAGDQPARHADEVAGRGRSRQLRTTLARAVPAAAPLPRLLTPPVSG